MKETSLAILLGILGLMQIVGDLFHLDAIKGLGMASGASPAPKVFCVAEGLETFSSQFFIHWQDQKGQRQHLELTPERARRLKGPYNRRNVYGAILSYGPVLSQSLAMRPAYRAVLQYAVESGTLLKELGLKQEEMRGDIAIEVAPKPSCIPAHLQLIEIISLGEAHE